MMSVCFTWFSYWCFMRTQYIPELGLNYNVWGFYLKDSENDFIVDRIRVMK